MTPLVLAFSAGMLASVNPCGFAMLPAFVSYYLTGEDQPMQGFTARAAGSLRLSLMATLGFLATALAMGLVISLGGRALVYLTPWAGLAIGVLLALLGVWSLFSGRSLPVAIPVRWDATSRHPRSMLLFGVAYALASLGCTLPLFLSIVGSALAMEALVPSLLVFVSYGLGMGTVLATIAVGAALFQTAVSKHIRRVTPYVHRLGALVLIGVGVYLVYYQVFRNPFLLGGS